MLKKKNRADRRTMAEVFKAGRSINSQSLTFKFISKTKEAQISFVVPKSLYKTAISRNKLRRQGYVALREAWPKLPFPMQGAFIFKKNPGKISLIKDEIEYIFNKIS